MTEDRRLQDLILRINEEARPVKACSVCRNEALARAVLHWQKLLADGTVTVMLPTMREQLFRKIGPASYDTIRRHVRDCLRRDVTTGKPKD